MVLLPNIPKLSEEINIALCGFDFNDLPYLSLAVIKMDSYTITFSVEVVNDNKIEPLETIINMIRTDSIITVIKTNISKEGVVLFKTIFNKFKFLSINNLLELDYTNSDYMKIDVSYTFEDIEFINCNDLQKERTIKINKLLKREFKYPYLTKKELNIK